MLTQIAEIRREIGRCQGMVDVSFVKLDAIQRSLRAIWLGLLMLSVLLTLDLLATGFVLGIAALQMHKVP